MNKFYCGRDDFHYYIVDLTEHYIDLGKESNYLRFANYVHPDAIKQWVESLYNHDHYENYWIFYKIDDKIITVGHLLIFNDNTAEFFLTVSDDYQQQGYGSSMVDDLIEWASQYEIKLIECVCTKDNKNMITILKKNGFIINDSKEFINEYISHLKL